MASSSPPSDPVDALAGALGAELSRDFGSPSFPSVDGYALVGVAPRTFRERVVVASFERAGETLCFIVTPTNPAERAYRRTALHDVVYFSEDVPDAEQSRIYTRDRAMIDRFVGWLRERDERAGAGA